MKTKNIKLSILLLALFTTSMSCTDLKENMYSTLSEDSFYKNSEQVEAAVMRPYTHANAWDIPTGQYSGWLISELPGDQLAWPQKGADGYDGGEWMRQHYHTWKTRDGSITNAWKLMWWGLGLCNNAITTISNNSAESMGIEEEEKAAYVAELRSFRAYHYLKIMDLWGNVPIVTEVGIPAMPETQPRSAVYNFIESELLAVVNDLPVLSGENSGRVTQAAAYAMLSQLYLNAEVWTGTPEWDKCIAACNKIIDGGVGSQMGGSNPSLDADMDTPFSNANSVMSNENLWVHSYQNPIHTCGWGGFFYHYDSKQIYDIDFDGFNAIVVVPSAYDAYDDLDLRKSSWFRMGPQYKYGTSDPVICGANREYNGEPLVFVNNIQRNSEGKTVSDMTQGEENSGARFDKYKSGTKSDANYRNNDWVLFRLTEIYFNKAEALMRQSGGAATAEALQLINDCKKRAFLPVDFVPYDASTLTMDELLAERGREFIFEGKRRTDLIRFGVFGTNSWWDHVPGTTSTSGITVPNNNKELEIFPIPYAQTSVNRNLIQNPGYSD